MRTLKQSVLATYDYQQTKKLCLDYPTAFDCDWELWRDKAQADFGISADFFNLITALPGYERYLQISSYFGVNKDCAVRVYPDGTIEGVYESYLAVNLAIEQGNKEVYEFFLSRLPPYLQYKVRRSRPNWVRVLWGEVPFSGKDVNILIEKGYPPAVELGLDSIRKREGEYFEYYLSFIVLGNKEILDEIIPIFLYLPEGFIFSRDELPIYSSLGGRGMGTDKLSKFLDACLRSGNVKLLDYYERAYDLSNYRRFSQLQPFYSSPDPEGSYIIFCRHFRYFTGNSLVPLIFAEAWKFAFDNVSATRRGPLFNSLVEFVGGNIAFDLSLPEFTLLSAADERKINVHYYPLTRRI